MKGAGVSVLPVGAGFRTDVQKLLKDFRDLNTMRFTQFSQCFRAAKFSHVFYGRVLESEYREFCERALSTCVTYCMQPLAQDLLDKVAGLYLLYSMYYLQSPSFVMKVRVTVRQLEELNFLSKELKDGGHLDSMYTLHKLFVDHAFHVSAFPDEHNPLTTAKRFENEELLAAAAGATAGGSRIESEISRLGNQLNLIVADPLLQSLKMLHREYSDSKQQLNLLNANESQIVDDAGPANTAVRLAEELDTRLVRRHHTTADEASAEPDMHSKVVRERRAGIRERAYQSGAAGAKHRRHRTHSFNNTPIKAESKSEPPKTVSGPEPVDETLPDTDTNNQEAPKSRSRKRPAPKVKDSSELPSKRRSQPAALPTSKRGQAKREKKQQQKVEPEENEEAKKQEIDVDAVAEDSSVQSSPRKSRKSLPRQRVVPVADDTEGLVDAASPPKQRRGRPMLSKTSVKSSPSKVTSSTKSLAKAKPPVKSAAHASGTDGFDKPNEPVKRNTRQRRSLERTLEPGRALRASSMAFEDDAADPLRALLGDAANSIIGSPSATMTSTLSKEGTRTQRRRHRPFSKSALGSTSGHDMIDAADRQFEKLLKRRGEGNQS